MDPIQLFPHRLDVTRLTVWSTHRVTRHAVARGTTHMFSARGTICMFTVLISITAVVVKVPRYWERWDDGLTMPATVQNHARTAAGPPAVPAHGSDDQVNLPVSSGHHANEHEVSKFYH